MAPRRPAARRRTAGRPDHHRRGERLARTGRGRPARPPRSSRCRRRRHPRRRVGPARHGVRGPGAPRRRADARRAARLRSRGSCRRTARHGGWSWWPRSPAPPSARSAAPSSPARRADGATLALRLRWSDPRDRGRSDEASTDRRGVARLRSGGRRRPLGSRSARRGVRSPRGRGVPRGYRGRRSRGRVLRQRDQSRAGRSTAASSASPTRCWRSGGSRAPVTTVAASTSTARSRLRRRWPEPPR